MGYGLGIQVLGLRDAVGYGFRIQTGLEYTGLGFGLGIRVYGILVYGIPV